MFCKFCIDAYATRKVAEGDSVSPKMTTTDLQGLTVLQNPQCPCCDTPFEDDELQAVKIKDPTSMCGESSAKDTSNVSRSIGSKQQIGQDITGYRPTPTGAKKSKEVSWLKKCDTGKGEIYMSTKMKALREEVLSCRNGNDTDKKIIYVQWVEHAILLGTMLQKDDIPFVYFFVSLCGSTQRGNKVADLCVGRNEHRQKESSCQG